MNRSLSIEARSLTYRPEERIVIFRKLSIPEQSATFLELSAHMQQVILSQLRIQEIVDLLDNMDMWQVERVLTRIPNLKYRQQIVKQLKGEVRDKIDYFLRFHPQATLSLINFNYLFLSSTLTIGEAASIIDEHYKETGKYPELLVHNKGRLIGEVPFATMVRERNSTPLRKYVQSLASITFKSDIPEIIELILSTNSKKIIVLDNDESVLGLIYSDAVKPLFDNLTSESLYDFAGVASSERASDGVWKKVQARYKWLIINLGTGFLAASVVSLFENTLNEIVLLAIYMPIVAGMGGNAATQTLAVMVRGISVGEVSLKNGMKPILNEVGAGFINGLINGVLVAIVAILWNENPGLGFVIGTAMVCNLVIAGFFGAFIPLFMKAIGKDPATSATIFITTATDVFGFFVFLGLATIILL